MTATPVTKRRKLGYERRTDGATGFVVGRFAWTLQQLADAGDRGVTPFECPAPRWSHYVHILRKDHGFDIETIEEKHQGEFPGTHGRYVLHDVVQLAPDDPPERKDPSTGQVEGPQYPKLAGDGRYSTTTPDLALQGFGGRHDR